MGAKRFGKNVKGAVMDDLVAGCSARRALQLTRSAPGLVTVLIGIKQPNYVRQNLELCKRPLLEMK